MSRRQTGGLRYPDEEPFVWREWAVPFALAAAVAALVVARALLTPAPIALEVPVVAPVAPVATTTTTATAATARPVQQAVALADIPPPSIEESRKPPVAPGVRVLLRCEGTTWAEAASDGAEQRRYELGPGQNLELAARDKLALAIGDAGVIRLRVNERELGFIGDKGEAKSGMTFTAGKAPAAVPPAPSPRDAAGD